jgi:Flp pilus assembly protein TadD
MLKKLLGIIALIVLTAAVFSSGLSGEFILGDSVAIRHNPAMAESNPLKILAMGVERHLFPVAKPTPISILTYRMNIGLSGLNPRAFRMTNLALHLLSVLLLFFFVHNYLFDKKLARSLIACAFFALNPIAVHVISHTSGRPLILAAVFGIGSMILISEYRKSGGNWKVILIGTMAILALMSSLTALVLPFAFLALDSMLYSGRKVRFLLAFMGLLIPAAIIAVDSVFIIHDNVGILSAIPLENTSAPFLFMHNFSAVFYPFRLSPFVSPASIFAAKPFPIITGAIFSGIVIFSLIKRQAPKERIPALSLTLISILLVPSIFVPRHGTLEFGALYFPAMFGGVFFAEAIYDLCRPIRRKFPKLSPEIILSALLILLMAKTAHLRGFEWTNEILLAETHIQNHGESAPVNASMAKSMLEIDENHSAIIFANRAVAIDSANSSHWTTLAAAYSNIGQNKAAMWVLQKYRELAEEEPPEWKHTAAIVHLREGRKDIAKGLFAEAAEKYPPSNFALARILFDEGNYIFAVDRLKVAEKKDPFDAKIYYLLSEAYEALGDNTSARMAWRRYLELPGIKTAEFVGDEDAPGVIPKRKQED